MIKHSLLFKNNNHPQKKTKEASNISLLDFLKKGTQAISQKSEAALTKIHHKMIEEQNVYVLPPDIRKKLSSQDRTSKREEVSQGKQRLREISKSNGQLSRQNTQRLNELMKKKHQLMIRLRKIDQELYNPSLLPVTIESNNSFHPTDLDKLHTFKGIESRLNFKQSNTYNLVQHQRNIQMLTKINNQKMKRQEKIVSEMKKKQEAELKKLEELEKNKSKLQQSRQSRLLPIMKAINKRQTQKLHESESADSEAMHYHSFQKEKEGNVNEFDQIQDIQIGSIERLPTESNTENNIEQVQ